MTELNAPWHAHIYFTAAQRSAAETLRDAFLPDRNAARIVSFVSPLASGPVGPHPIPQFEVHFRADALPAIRAAIEPTGLTALIHPLTQDDVADHTTLAQWIGAPLALDLSVLDPPGRNQGVARFGKSEF